MLLERRAFAAELALGSAREAYRDGLRDLEVLNARRLELEEEFRQAVLGRDRDRRAYEYRIHTLKQAVRVAQQEAESERALRLELQHGVGAERRLWEERDGLARTLAAERRADMLAAEVELLSHSAAEFEYGVRVALGEAFKLLADLTGRVRSIIDAIPGVGQSHSGPRGELEPPGEDFEPLNTERLDAALSRLRARTPPLQDLDDDST
jgi:hypothetical protein